MGNDFLDLLQSSSEKELKDRINKALDTIFRYGQIDGDHHKAWVIDQVVRNLLGDKYEEFITLYKTDEDSGEEEYEWEEGIAP